MKSLFKFTIKNLQKELEVAKIKQECVASEKENLEKKLKEHRATPATQVGKGTESELQVMRQELEVRKFALSNDCRQKLNRSFQALRMELKRAEGELEDRCWSPPIGLQQWLQLTHEIENKAYMKKKSVAERQLQQAREAVRHLVLISLAFKQLILYLMLILFYS